MYSPTIAPIFAPIVPHIIVGWPKGGSSGGVLTVADPLVDPSRAGLELRDSGLNFRHVGEGDIQAR